MILTYHEILSPGNTYRYGVTSDRLGEHLAFLNEHCGDERGSDPFQITFDDGHQSNYEQGLPVLEEYNRRATFFVTVGHIGTRGDAMSWAQLRRLTELGHTVQSHGWSHKFLTHCTNSELNDEIERSKKVLEDSLGRPVEAISMPGGRFNSHVLSRCAAAGFKRIFDSNPWRQAQYRDGMCLTGRLMVQRTMNAGDLNRVLGANGSRLVLLRARQSAKMGVQKLLGDQLYHELWCLLSSERARRQLNNV